MEPNHKLITDVKLENAFRVKFGDNKDISMWQ